MNIINDSEPLSCKSITYNKLSSFGPRIQQDLQLVYVYSGDITIQVGRHTYEVTAGEATLLTPGETEFFRFASRALTRHGWCVAPQTSLAPEVIPQLQKRPDILPFSSDMRQLASMAMSVPETGKGLRLYRSGLIKALFLEFISRTNCFDDETPQLHPSVTRAVRFIDESAPRNLTVQDMAHAAGVTPAHLIRLFKAAYQVTPKEYFWRRRIAEAAQLLRETGLTAAEVAFQTGFSNPHHFSKVFKRYQGMPPGRFRKQAWKRTGQTHGVKSDSD